MAKRVILAIAAVFVALMLLSMAMHGGVLGRDYELKPGLFRPVPEMKAWLSILVTVVLAVCFVLAYSLLVGKKSPGAGLVFGLLWGAAAGASMGFGSYSAMPIPLYMAGVWCVGTLVEFVVAGLLVGLIVKPSASAEKAS